MDRRGLLMGSMGLALSPALAGAQPVGGADVEILGEGFQFPEGPIVFPDGSVVFVEVARGTLTRVWKGARSEIVATLGGGPNGAALGPDGAVYVCNNGGLKATVGPDGRVSVGAESSDDYAGGSIQRVDLSTGKVDRLYDRAGASKLNGPNDLVFDRTGGFWFSDFGKTSQGRRDLSALYYARPDGSRIEQAIGGALSYNGVGLSPDEKTLYVADTMSARIWACTLAAPGAIEGAPQLLATVPGHLTIDSLKVARSGAVCVACALKGGIATVRPDGSVGHAPLPETVVANLAFGGEDMRELTVCFGLRGAVARVRWPEPGLKLNFNLY